MKNLFFMYVLSGLVMGSSLGRAQFIANEAEPPPEPPVPYTEFVYGVTLDSVTKLNDIVDSLKSLQKRPTARIVFDEFVPATSYANAVNSISQVSQIMGEILDSFYVKRYSAAKYQQRVVEYYNAFKDKVTIWEVGNEINGEWLGSGADQKIIAAYDYVKAAGGKTAVTLYYNQNCWSNANNEMFKWATNKLPARMKSGLDYVLVSYYEDDCNGLQPDWNKVFTRLAGMFPNSKIGFGECGTTKSAKKAEYIKRYYSTRPNIPNFIGGYFWWYFIQDMVPKTKPLWSTLNNALGAIGAGDDQNPGDDKNPKDGNQEDGDQDQKRNQDSDSSRDQNQGTSGQQDQNAH